ncbi:MAG: hypothetical protein KJZ74_12370 [Gemmatimonadales bacterium]|nr:hypothetical protein [Gemmatimonadota bacterium]MCL4214697.1 hypothetical protein [Gemmatimonadales bacterium]
MSLVQTRGALMTEYARGICARLANADQALRESVAAGDSAALLVGMAEREASLAATEDLVGELDLSGLSAAEHAAIIRLMVQALERSQVAQAALEAELFRARRAVVRALSEPAARAGAVDRSGYSLQVPRKVLRSTG